MKKFLIILVALLLCQVAYAQTNYQKLATSVNIKNQELMKILAHPKTFYYTDAELPPAYQDFEGALDGIWSPYYNVSAVQTEPFGNANREFPWGKPFGTHNVKNSHSFRFIHLPLINNQYKPIVWWRTPYTRGYNRNGYSWAFPVGTVVGEVLYMHDPKGFGRVYEIRTRTRKDDRWSPNVFRPFPTAKH